MGSLRGKTVQRAGGGTVRPADLTAAAAAGGGQCLGDSSLRQSTSSLSRGQSLTLSSTVLRLEGVLSQTRCGH